MDTSSLNHPAGLPKDFHYRLDQLDIPTHSGAQDTHDDQAPPETLPPLLEAVFRKRLRA